ncbi:helix-turn-helix domain-containing protein [Leifsonia shinshuensis]|uniref:Helix-turn-helix domain-containing protein n=1 Tax=Leifsonia shinshuensis TaxID=150026 RepID=A0A7G6YA32_9MICO|nr:XRE family transcriptional regulator [Leifsonia shinshuensis]QNE35347.1 helix-turn-helix domain-containing protein [Leifsonia shinshuensis]
MRPMPLEPSERKVPLGPRLRAARQARGMTIEELARTTDLTKGFLSRVERDMTSPSVSSLVSICDVLSIQIGTLFEQPDVQLVRDGDGPKVNLGGVDTVERLVSPRGEGRLQVIRSTINPEGNGGNDLYAVAADVDVLHVLAGQVQVQFSDNVWDLGPGDTLTFSGHEPHNWRVLGDEVAEVIWVLVPALWSS